MCDVWRYSVNLGVLIRKGGTDMDDKYPKLCHNDFILLLERNLLHIRMR